MFSLPIPFVDDYSINLIEKTNINKLHTDSKFEDYGMETISFAYVATIKALPIVGAMAGLGLVVGLSKGVTMILPKVKLLGMLHSFISKTIMFNLPIRYLQETSVDLFISAGMSVREGFFGSRRREMPSIIEVSGIISIVFFFIIAVYTVFMTLHMC
jgi:hypothetical protein